MLQKPDPLNAARTEAQVAPYKQTANGGRHANGWLNFTCGNLNVLCCASNVLKPAGANSALVPQCLRSSSRQVDDGRPMRRDHRFHPFLAGLHGVMMQVVDGRVVAGWR